MRPGPKRLRANLDGPLQLLCRRLPFNELPRSLQKATARIEPQPMLVGPVVDLHQSGQIQFGCMSLSCQKNPALNVRGPQMSFDVPYSLCAAMKKGAGTRFQQTLSRGSLTNVNRICRNISCYRRSGRTRE